MKNSPANRLVMALLLPVASLIVVLTNGARSQTPQIELPYEGVHLSPIDGVLRDPSLPRGDCGQCHTLHADVLPQARNLFAPNDNSLCYSVSGIGGCHINRPDGGTAGYPAQEQDRFGDLHPYHGYFEVNTGAARMPGLDNRTRWPGRTIWENSQYSAHYSSPAMPRLDGTGRGACLNCHDPHNGATPYDQLKFQYGPISGSGSNAAPAEYAMCLSCHSATGPSGMSLESRRIADYYAGTSLGARNAGHAIGSTRGAVEQGDRLPCYDCHNPHGSEGSDGQSPNAYLISDQRTGWYGLTDIRNDSVQVRRFCVGCHAYGDQPGSGGTVEGITPVALPNEYPHRSIDTRHCYDCHGRDYTSPNGFNVHNPWSGAQQGGG